MLLGINHLSYIFAQVITTKTLFASKKPEQLLTVEVNFKGCVETASKTRLLIVGNTIC